MFKNYLTVALRNLLRNKTFSVINILGLSIGISSALVIFLIASYEFSFDRFEKNRDRIYKVVLDASFSGTQIHSGAVPAPLGAAIQNEVTGVELTVPVFQFQGDGNAKVLVPGNSPDHPVVFKKQSDIVFTNPQYFHLLSSFQWVTGSPESALKEPFSVVLTESRARLYFPTLSPDKTIGRQLTYNDDLRVTVSGVVKDLHEHTDFAGSEFISLATIEKTNLQDHFMMTVWNDWMAYSKLYVKLSAGSSKERTDTQLAGLFKKYGQQGSRDNTNTMTARLLPLAEMHFTTDYVGFGQRIVSKPTLYGLLAIAGFLLLLATINFINLSTAQSTRRAKEIGIRKTMGSSRAQLIRQFLSETFFLVTLATLLSVAFTPLLLKIFADFIPPGLQPQWLERPGIPAFLLLLIVTVSLLAGIYPAFVLSRFNPVQVLKNRFFTGNGRTDGVWIRKTLTVSQFVIAQFFIIAALLVSKQIHYSLNQDLGFRKESILTFETEFDTASTRRTQLLNEIKAIPEVEMASTGFFSPGDEGNSMGNIQFKERPDIHTEVAIRWGDSSYLNLYQVKLLAGRNVRSGDTAKEVLINETYAKLLGFFHPEKILNKPLSFNGQNLPIVGVMGDFHEESMHKSIMPLAFAGMPGTKFHVRLRPGGAGGEVWKSGIAKIQHAFRQAYPDADFQYAFVDETVAKWYQSEQNTSRLLYWATGLTIFISCLGLLGLVTYTTNMRTKEIGVRKVLGASITSILSILSKEFIRLVMLAFLIAVPIAWWAANRWLQDFAYRTPINAWVFLGGGAGLLVVALITLSIQTIRAATANPINSLRTE